MPRLSLLHWLVLVIVLVFYGFAVFALTRDYYLRHPAQPAATAAPANTAERPPLDTSAIPKAITETNPELLHQRADELFMQQRFDEAMLVYRRILELNPEDAEAYNELGLTLHYSGDIKGALEHLRTAVAKGPRLQRNWLTLGFVSLQAGNKADAKSALERARDLDPNSDIGKEAAKLLVQVATP
jgi:tetratricopeptide (TPR) repeat protein